MDKGPKYQNLAEVIRRNIKDGIYTDGYMLDTENELGKKVRYEPPNSQAGPWASGNRRYIGKKKGKRHIC